MNETLTAAAIAPRAPGSCRTSRSMSVPLPDRMLQEPGRSFFDRRCTRDRTHRTEKSYQHARSHKIHVLSRTYGDHLENTGRSSSGVDSRRVGVCPGVAPGSACFGRDRTQNRTHATTSAEPLSASVLRAHAPAVEPTSTPNRHRRGTYAITRRYVGGSPAGHGLRVTTTVQSVDTQEPSAGCGSDARTELGRRRAHQRATGAPVREQRGTPAPRPGSRCGLHEPPGPFAIASAGSGHRSGDRRPTSRAGEGVTPSAPDDPVHARRSSNLHPITRPALWVSAPPLSARTSAAHAGIAPVAGVPVRLPTVDPVPGGGFHFGRVPLRQSRALGFSGWSGVPRPVSIAVVAGRGGVRAGR